MKRVATIFGVFVICSLSASLAQGEKTATAELFLNRWVATLQTGNFEQMVSLYEDSNDVIVIQSTGKIRKGIGEIRKEYESAFHEVVFEKAELENLIIRHDGDLAWAACRFRADTKTKQDNSTWILEIYTSFLLKRTDSKLRIVLEQSTPIDGIPRVRPR